MLRVRLVLELSKGAGAHPPAPISALSAQQRQSSITKPHVWKSPGWLLGVLLVVPVRAAGAALVGRGAPVLCGSRGPRPGLGASSCYRAGLRLFSFLLEMA